MNQRRDIQSHNVWMSTRERSNLVEVLDDPEKGDPVIPCLYVYKGNIQSDGSIEKLKLRILVRGDLHNK